MSKVTIEHYGIEGTGRNVTEAKRDAGERIKRFVRRADPVVYSWRGSSVVVSATPDGGARYSLIHPDDDGRKVSASYGADFDDVLLGAVRHLLANCRQIGEYDVPAWVPQEIDRRALVSDWRRSDGFTLAYRAAEKMTVNELNGRDCHSWACDHIADFAPVAV